MILSKQDIWQVKILNKVYYFEWIKILFVTFLIYSWWIKRTYVKHVKRVQLFFLKWFWLNFLQFLLFWTFLRLRILFILFRKRAFHHLLNLFVFRFWKQSLKFFISCLLFRKIDEVLQLKLGSRLHKSKWVLFNCQFLFRNF